VKEHHFVRPGGPLGPFADDYRIHLVASGYAFGSIQHLLTQFALVSRWLDSEGLTAGELNEAQAQRFAASRRARARVTLTSAASMRVPLAFLRSIGVVAAKGEPEGPFEELLSSYRSYLFNERGLAEKTVVGHVDGARRFCLGTADTPGELADLRGSDVTSYLLRTCSQQSSPTARRTVGAVSSLLVYLHVTAVIPVSLISAVPKVAGPQRCHRPPELSASQLAHLLESCDRRSCVGRRNYAILMVLARLGLRPCEVVALTLDDIDWHHGELLVRGKANRHERLPLPSEVGSALASYLQEGRQRPTDGCREVFLRARAPWTALSFPGVQTVVREASRRAGLDLIGPRHLRRHAATQMHRNGMSLSAIATVLRHHDTWVTTVYVDVDDSALSGLARVWPGA
jgi:integrase/recombinase XerD